MSIPTCPLCEEPATQLYYDAVADVYRHLCTGIVVHGVVVRSAANRALVEPLNVAEDTLDLEEDRL